MKRGPLSVWCWKNDHEKGNHPSVLDELVQRRGRSSKYPPMDSARVWHVWRTDSWLLLYDRRQRCLWRLSSPNDLHQAGSKRYSGQSSSSFRVPARWRILGEALHNRATLLKRELSNIPIADFLPYVPPHFAGNEHTVSDFHSCPLRSIIHFPLCGRWHPVPLPPPTHADESKLVISSHGLWLKWWTASEAQTSAGIISATGGAHFADAYPRQIDVLTHISPFWRTYSSNDNSY